MSVIKSFGTFLVSNSSVSFQSTRYKLTQKKSTIVPPAELMKTLTDRKIASEEQETFNVQQKAQEQKQKLASAKALADMQGQIVEAEQSVMIADRKAQTRVKEANGEAESMKLKAKAQAEAATKDLYHLPPEEDALIPTVCSSLEQALEYLDKDREFLTRGGVFTDDWINAYIELKMGEVNNVRMTPHPIEFGMYYSC